MFTLKKDWVDQVPGVDMVEIHFTWSPAGEKPDWDRLEETRTLRPVPGTSPTYRVCGIEIPREVEGGDPYDLHHFFVYVQDRRELVSPTYAEEIGSREITYEDRQGLYTLVGTRWAVGDWLFPNYTLLPLAGLELELPTYSNPYTPGASPGSGLELPRIYEFVKSRPLPHVFRGKVHGPRGAAVQYHLHQLTVGGPTPQHDRETWNTNNDRSWTVTIA
jgi:hypothetical protein